ncbi:MAG TPA: MFS transporter [Anaeromyxobacteraceae bacterium]|nr:MFS transporter [Anaeromyxobacteraceae bacterium]
MTAGVARIAREALASSLRAAGGGLPRAYWALWAGILVNRLGGFVVPFLALYLTRIRGLSVDRAGAVVSLFGLGALGAGPVAGLLADRVGRRATLLLSLVGGGLLTIALAFEKEPGPLAVLVFLTGFVGEIYRPPAHAVVADVVPPADRRRAFGLLYWAVNLGFSIGLVLAGLLSQVSFSLLFVADGVTTLAFAFIVFRNVPETRPAEAAREPAGEALAGILAPFRDRDFALFFVLQFLLVVVFMQFSLGLPIDMTSHGVSAAGFGSLVALNGLLIVLLQPAAARFVARFDGAPVMAVGAVLVGTGFGMNSLHDTVPWYAAGIVVWTFGEILTLPIASAIPAELSSPALRGRYQGAFAMTWAGASVVAPVVGSHIIARFGAPALWTCCFALGVVAAAGHLAVGPARRRRLAGLRAASTRIEEPGRA